MLQNIWTITLLVCSTATLFLVGRALFTAIPLLRFFNHGSDTALQIRLENENILAAALIQTALVIQIITLVIFVMAADKFSGVLAGAMCATGSLLANTWGFYAFYSKLAGCFLYGFWIVLHSLDMKAENYPLTRVKYKYILFLFPFLLLDTLLQILYFVNLSPDIITSCCGVLFDKGGEKHLPLLASVSASDLLFLFYGLVGMQLLLLLLCWLKKEQTQFVKKISVIIGLVWIVLFPYSLYVVTMVISSFFYMMPYHHCPFCILKPEYFCVGYPLYISLMAAAFLGFSSSFLHFFSRLDGAEIYILEFQKKQSLSGFTFLFLFVFICSLAPLYYYFGS